MKRLLLLTLFLASLFTNVLGQATVDQAVAELLDTLKVSEFAKHLSYIKETKSADHLDQKSYHLKKLISQKNMWYYFDEKDFVEGLKNKLEKNFSPAEIKEINKIMKDPFMLKVVNQSILYRDLFSYHRNSLSEKYNVSTPQASRSKLIENLYVLHGMSIQTEHLKKRLKSVVDSGKLVVNIFSQKDKSSVIVDTKKLKNRLANAKVFVINYFADEMTDFRHYEIRDYFRRVKKSKTIQKFLQLYANYHFLYVTKYIEKVEQDKLDELKALKVIK
ncbi:MAG: hypothetical protein CME62_12795 [Halobacteriovoraceae bacterium]|nr:hypothetical protein [Halobacteriovoraceae bacterium]|tara:strand:- start:4492 stop:5316 length:825 start_codon:yes stop_codon:yes gene_type:complete